MDVTNLTKASYVELLRNASNEQNVDTLLFVSTLAHRDGMHSRVASFSDGTCYDDVINMVRAELLARMVG